jgi:uncharacterized protein
MNEPLQQGLIEVPVDSDSRWWWKAIGEGRLLLPHCQSCGRHFFPPQPTCPRCGSDRWQQAESRGSAVVYSWVVIHTPLHDAFAMDTPYVIVAAELDEGVRLFGRLGGDQSQLRAGAPLAPYFYKVRDQSLLGFELVDDDGP